MYKTKLYNKKYKYSKAINEQPDHIRRDKCYGLNTKKL